MILDSERVIHSFKTAFACLIGFAITKSIHFYFDQWLIITILVVMCAQLNVGSVIQKSYMRFLGTLTGSIIAALILEFFGTDPYIIALTITISALIFSYIATGETSVNEAGTLGVATITIILIGKTPSLTIAFARFAEISIGILIAALVSQFVLPIHARRHLKNLQATTLKQLRSYYLATFLTDQTKQDSYQELDEAIAKSLATQRKLAIDAKREPFGDAFDANHFKKLLNCEKEILRCIGFMHRSYYASVECRNIFSSIEFMHDFHDRICQSLQSIAIGIEKRTPIDKTISLPDIQLVKYIIDNEYNHLKSDDITNANGFLFCAEILVNRISELANLATKTNTASS